MKGLFFVICFLPAILFGQIKNLVLEGGGVRGIAYVGAIQALEEREILCGIENVSGTSVGSIAAVLLCIGYTSEELKRELSSIKIQEFNDGKGIFFGGIHRTNTQFGWYRGERLTKWINDLIEKKTGIADMTFKQLSAFADKDSSYKNLFVTATNLSEQKSEVISHRNYPDMRLADAVRISASIPLYYSAVFLDSTGRVYPKPPDDIQVNVMADGGILDNYPIHTFDDHYPSHATLGLRLDESDQIREDVSGERELAPYEINSLRDYVGAFYNLVIENLNRCNLTEEDWDRTVSISTCGVGPKVKRLKQSEINLLINAGYESVMEFLPS